MNQHFKIADGAPVTVYDSTIELNGKVFGLMTVAVKDPDYTGPVLIISHVASDGAFAFALNNLPDGWSVGNDDADLYETYTISYTADSEIFAMLEFVLPITFEMGKEQMDALMGRV